MCILLHVLSVLLQLAHMLIVQFFAQICVKQFSLKLVLCKSDVLQSTVSHAQQPDAQLSGLHVQIPLSVPM